MAQQHIVPRHIQDAILWQEIYEQAIHIGMDMDSARIYATETLEDIQEATEYDRWAAYNGEY